VKNVCLKLGTSLVLSGASFEVRDRLRPGLTTGQLVAILGPSGVGKTRLLRIIAGLDSPDDGEVRGVGGHPIVPGSVGVVFQNYPLLRHRTIEQNLDIAGAAGGLTREEAKARTKSLLARFSLSDRARFYPAQLSGGQRQRVAIAQQLVKPRNLLLMDEPFSGLDPATLDEVIRLIVEVANMDELNTIVLVTHDIRAAMVVSDTIHMLGRERLDGKPVPGARMQASFDLVERGLAWQLGVEELPAFGVLEKEIKGRFAQL
jgi:polar amino acid transport system ATP-binding protein/sulfate transport system ATP-binding protein